MNYKELYHHGILGMKWGKRNGPPYPLNESAKSAAEKKENGKKERLKKAVERYQKQADKATDMMNEADDLWEDVKSQYHSLAKTPFGRFKEIYKAQAGKGSTAAQKYIRDFDKVSYKSDKADAEWALAMDLYKKTGKTYVTRVFNNIRYHT